MSGKEKREFGDYQTPMEFCHKVCDYVKKEGLSNSIKAILEPTCGIGNFLLAASNTFGVNKFIAIDINEKYARISKARVPSAVVVVNNIFDVKTRELCGADDVLVIGNPPWATNSDLTYNLPRKINFKGLRGIDALTGSSNFDICEYIILQLLNEYKNTDSVICMLCKTSVARNVILEMSKNHVRHLMVEMLSFNSYKVFGVAASACVLIIKLSSNCKSNSDIICKVKDFSDESIIDTLIASNGAIKTINSKIDLEGKCQLIWRQGVKHDCGKVMELGKIDGKFVTRDKTAVMIEEGLIFPLVKSSHFKKPIISEFSKFVIVTQTCPRQDTSYIQAKYPLTWKYLNANIDSFTNRKSVIYKNSAPFSMFGVGDYSFAPYKVGLSGFYKKPLFCLLYSAKPVMTDDTAYFLSFNNYDLAYCVMLLMNSQPVQEFLLSIAFLDNKRPYTVKLLSRLDIKKCIDAVSFEEIKQVEAGLQLAKYLTKEMYYSLAKFINNRICMTTQCRLDAFK